MKRVILISSAAAVVMVGCGGQTSSNGFNSYDSSLGQPPATSVTGPAAIPNAAAWPKVNDKSMLIFGVGAPVLEKLVVSKDDLSKNQELDQAFTEVSSLGFNVVRLTLFNDAAGLKLNKDGYVDGLADGVEKNLSALVNMAKNKKVKLFLGFAETFSGYTKNPVTDIKAQDAYLKNAVATVARKVKGNDSVFALSVSGEINAVAETDKDKGVTWEQVRTFIKAASDSVKKQDPQRLITAGPYVNTKLTDAQVTSFGLDFYEVSTDGTLPLVNTLGLNRPVLLHTILVKDGDTKMNALKSVESGYAGFFYPTLGWKGTDVESALLDKDGKPTQLANTLSGVVKELAVPATATGSLTGTPVVP